VSPTSRANTASAQHTIPIAYGGRPFLVFVDEGGSRLADRSEGWWGLQCTDNGFMILKFTDGAYPLPPLETSPVPPAPEQSTSAEVSVASPDTSAKVRVPKAAADPTPSIRGSGGRFALSAARLRLAYVCMIVPQLDERSVEQLISAAPPSKSGKGTNSVTARP